MFRMTHNQRVEAGKKAAHTRALNAVPGSRTGNRVHYKYTNHSARPGAPYAQVMQESDARIALALARLDAVPDSALPAPRQCRTIIEHKGTGELRYYPISPLRQQIMSAGGGEPPTQRTGSTPSSR